MCSVCLSKKRTLTLFKYLKIIKFIYKNSTITNANTLCKLIADDSFFLLVDTEIPIIKHSSSPPTLPTHNQPQQISHQNQQQTHHQTQRNHLQTSHHHQQQQKQVSLTRFRWAECITF